MFQAASRQREPGKGAWQIRPAVFLGALPVGGSGDVGSGSRICPGLDLFHDATEARLLWRQETGAEGAALRLTAYQFDGAYLSLATGVPEAQAATARAMHLLTVSVEARATRPIGLLLRLNASAKRGQQTLHADRILSEETQRLEIPFELGALTLDHEAGLTLWVDLILHRPRMCEVVLHDIALTLGPSQMGGTDV